MKKLIIIFALLLSCQKEDEMLKILITSGGSPQLKVEENIIIMGTSNAQNRNTMLEMNTLYSDLPINGVISNAFYRDNTAIMKAYTTDMNQGADNVGGGGIEYRIAKNMIGVYTEKINLLKYGEGSSKMNGSGWAVGGTYTNNLKQRASLGSLVWNKIIVIGWENDCTNETDANAIEANFTALIAELRGSTNIASDATFYVLEMGDFTSGTTPFLNTGRTGIQNVADADTNVFTFKPTWLTPDANNFRDGIHYNAEVADLIALEAIDNIK